MYFWVRVQRYKRDMRYLPFISIIELSFLFLPCSGLRSLQDQFNILLFLWVLWDPFILLHDLGSTYCFCSGLNAIYLRGEKTVFLFEYPYFYKSSPFVSKVNYLGILFLFGLGIYWVIDIFAFASSLKFFK